MQPAGHDFERIAIVNRGETAMRLIHAVREINEGPALAGGAHLVTVALFTEPDREAMFVREADEAFALGPPTFVDPDDGERKSTYLDRRRLQEALVATGAEAAWVGWGFVAEHADFVELCSRLGVTFVGPPAEVMRRLGDKISAKRLAEQARVPVAPWSGGPVSTFEEARRSARVLGYPLMVKATAGGGGRGIRKVRSEAELSGALESARSEAYRAFGDPTVFLERLLPIAHHVEVQVVADRFGTAWALGVRDCSVQRRYQKVLEESSPPWLTPDQDRELRAASVRLAQAAGYVNAGTVEFLHDPESGAFSFMEVNARLQVEHPVTEATTGVDLVKLQLHVARGGSLEGDPPPTRGHAVEVRLNAEDPDANFAPAPGTVELFRLPTGPGVRVDTGVSEGDRVPPEFDSMIAKVIAWGRDRPEAMARLRRALRQTTVVIRGGASNKAFLLGLLERPELDAGRVDVSWLDRLAATGEHLSDRGADVALLQAAVEAYDAELAVEKAQFYASAARGRPRVRHQVGRVVELRHRGHTYALEVGRLGTGRYRVDADGRRIDVEVERLSSHEGRISCFGRSFRVVSSMGALDHLVEVDGVAHRISRGDAGVVRAPAPAVVIALLVHPGDRVAAGDRLAVVEAMKLEMSVSAPFPGRVAEVLVTANTQVEAGEPLVKLERSDALVGGTTGGNRVRFGRTTAPGYAPSPADRCRQTYEELRCQVLGFDVDPAGSAQLVAEQGEVCRFVPADDETVLRGEDEVLGIFADVCLLSSRRQPDPGDGLGEEVRSPQQHLFTYLRSLEARGQGLPATFLDNLRQALAHCGISDLDPSPQLEDALFWMFESHQRVEEHIAPILSILDRRLERIDQLGPLAGQEFRLLLDRLIAATQLRFPAVSELAREVHYAYFDAPLLERARQVVYAEAEQNLEILVRQPDAPDRDTRMQALVECPQSLKNLLTSRFPSADRERRRAMLEALTRRYYRIRRLDRFRSLVVDGHELATVEYDFEQQHICVFTTFAEYRRLDAAAAAIATGMAGVPVDDDVVVDIYAWHEGPVPASAQLAGEILAVLDRAPFPRPVRRIVVAVSGPDRGLGLAGIQHFTYRPAEGGSPTRYREEEICRGFHPMMGKRLDLWRLSNFRIERLPSVEDVYLFHGVAHDNSRDERLFALCEVRDVTPVLDESGRVVQLPHLERMLMESLASIRRFQSHREPERRLHWNRVLLYCRPPLRLQPDELHQVVQRLEPAMEGLGLEKIVIRARMPGPTSGRLRDTVLHLLNPVGTGLQLLRFEAPADRPIRPLSEYRQKVVQLRRRGLVYPYEIIRMLTPDAEGAGSDFPPGSFREYDLDPAGTSDSSDSSDEGRLVPVGRPFGRNRAGVVVGVISNSTWKYPEGMRRVIVLGDPSKGLGALAEPECRRIVAALDLAEELRVPLEWFAISSGARISMDSGTENMDWVARVLRRLVLFTQAGGEVNVVVNGINVGAQPYWNAEATMLMHTRGILVMTADGAMVLTGKQSLDYSGGVSAEDNYGIGGYERVMGPNGQAQYFARDLPDACRVLLRHYGHTYVAPGERFPRRAATTDHPERDVGRFPHPRTEGCDFTSVGDIFSDDRNPGRKKPFDIRTVMMAVVDQDHPPLERWHGMHEAEAAVVWDAHLGGWPVCVIGMESRPLPRRGFVPADGPDQWTSGTLFPRSAKKVARAINAASGNRPVVVLANLSGFDGSPESMRRLQLEYGAEIGRAVVNFDGPLVFCAISRYHGGAFVVFSVALNESVEVAALEGSYASVIGGAPAAAVVFAREVDARTAADPRVQELEREIAATEGTEKAQLRAHLSELVREVRSEKLGEVADEFDAVHSVQRAQKVGSVHHIIAAAHLRPYLVDALDRGVERELARLGRRPPPPPPPWSMSGRQ